jgi:hypothetical protein
MARPDKTKALYQVTGTIDQAGLITNLHERLRAASGLSMAGRR